MTGSERNKDKNLAITEEEAVDGEDEDTGIALRPDPPYTTPAEMAKWTRSPQGQLGEERHNLWYQHYW